MLKVPTISPHGHLQSLVSESHRLGPKITGLKFTFLGLPCKKNSEDITNQKNSHLHSRQPAVFFFHSAQKNQPNPSGNVTKHVAFMSRSLDQKFEAFSVNQGTFLGGNAGFSWHKDGLTDYFPSTNWSQSPPSTPVCQLSSAVHVL